MSLLELERVTRRYRSGAHECVVLSGVSLELDAGELLAVWGLRRSGRSTLLRVAAGVEPPDEGVVRFQGRDLARRGDTLGSGIGYCRPAHGEGEARGVLDELVAGQLARGVPQPAARSLAYTALERTGASQCAGCGLHELDGGESVRVSIARALALGPSLLVIDEPTKGVDLLERDTILALLRSLADEGIALLVSVGEATALGGADRALSLSDGELRGSLGPELAAVVPLRRRASA
ncbi:MAG TPA: ATP-binding cassette domain-containing protein [Solirubrobacteraceae bacterium]|jgi:energy-coupling factor transporter ATP-binding protein EcfA2|nr:ATP-binding cassette domain-containing protein [Solirubrobacteraceae bacterium]